MTMLLLVKLGMIYLKRGEYDLAIEWESTGLIDDEEIALASNNTQRDEALSALGVLGYPMKQTQKVVDALLQVEPDMPVDRLIKNALNKL